MNLPAALVKAAKAERHNKPGCVSATTLLKGVKEIVLIDRHWDELEDDVSNRIWLILGTAVHSIMESHGEGGFVEKHLEHDTGIGMTVTGQVDYYDEEKGIVVDWKTCSATKVLTSHFDDWRMQGLVYAWLLAWNGFTVNKIQFVGMMKDWSRSRAMHDKGYPQSPVYVYEYDVVDEVIEATDRFVMDKVAAIVAANGLGDDDIPPCGESERWQSPTVYAVMKRGVARSKKNCTSREDAELRVELLGDGHYVEVRPGVARKCQGYCICRKHCSFYRQQEAETIEKELA